MHRSQKLIRGFVLLISAAMAVAQPPLIPPPSPPYRIGNGVSQPTLLYKEEPTYSEEARRAKWQGNVQLELVVDESGIPKDIRVKRALGLGLDQKAIEAVQRWRFKPGQKDGTPVPVIAVIEVSFRLLDDPPAKPHEPLDPEKLAALEDLMSLMNLEGTLQQTSVMLRPLLEAAIGHAIDQSLPKTFDRALIADEIKILQRELFNRIFDQTRKQFRSNTIIVYGDLFTTPQIRDIAAFYRTPSGQALMSKMPEISAKGSAIGQQDMQKFAPELQKQISDWIANVKKTHGIP